MTPKDIKFLIKIEGSLIGVVLLILFCYYASQPQYLWDEAILLAADKTFWTALVLVLSQWALVKWLQRHHK